MDVRQTEEELLRESEVLSSVRREIEKVIIGQSYLIERLLIGLLCNNHVLIEGVPGLAKTMSVTTLSRAIRATFSRIQFTPDLLPADVVGTLIYNPNSGEFKPKRGPVFANVVLADEINRAPAKVQSALLEAMQERQVTIGDETHRLEEPFMVLATQNPIDQEGTYPLPEAQVDRFMLKLQVGYPSKEEELQILERMAQSAPPTEVEAVIGKEDVLRLRGLIDRVYMDRKVAEYVVSLVDATRNPSDYSLDLGNFVQYGASPRATIFLTLAAKAHALLHGRGYVTPHDIKSMAPDVLRHRLILSYEAEAEEETPDGVIGRILDGVEVP